MVIQSLLTPEEASVYLGVRQAQLKAMSLPVVMICREPRYLMRDLDRLVLSRRIVPVTDVARGA